MEPNSKIPDMLNDFVELAFTDADKQTQILLKEIRGSYYRVTYTHLTDETGRMFESAHYQLLDEQVSQETLEGIEDYFPFSETADFRLSSNGEFRPEVNQLERVRILESNAITRLLNGVTYRLEVTNYSVTMDNGKELIIPRTCVAGLKGMPVIFDYPYSGLTSVDFSRMMEILGIQST